MIPEIYVYDKSEWSYINDEPFIVYVINKKTMEVIVHKHSIVYGTDEVNKVLFLRISQPLFIVYKREIN